MKNNLIEDYKKINKNKQINHIVLQTNYDDLCMKFFADKYNTLLAQNIAQQSCNMALQCEDLYVDWLNKE